MTKLMLSVVIGGFLGLMFYVYHILVLRPKRLRSRLEKQGIKGPSSHFLFGNLIQLVGSYKCKTVQTEIGIHDHNWLGNAFPFIEKWRNEYGSIFMYWFVQKPMVCTSDVNMVREVFLNTTFNVVKAAMLSESMEPLLGRGIITSNGSIWKHHRKMVAPSLYPDRVKDMVELMVESTLCMLSSWGSRIESEKGTATIIVDKDLKGLTADILCRACFGSSYSKGEKIFSKLESLVHMMTKNPILLLPVFKNIPTKTNRTVWRLRKEIDSLILDVVRERARATAGEKDLLQMILDGARADDSSGSDFSYEKEIVDNCKNIYLAGSETPAVTLIWIMAMLAANPGWQSRARAEILDICIDGRPDSESIQKMKILTLVIQETLRFYPPTVIVGRDLVEDISFNGILIPKGTGIHIPIPLLHMNPEIWGNDAHEFNPERFSQGLARACKVPQVYVPFGYGNHICTGQNFAMTELKVVMSLILSKFEFSLSPSYVHSPIHDILLFPEHGLTLCISKL